MSGIKRSHIDEASLDRLLGLESSKIGFYSEVKQKIQELEAANLGLRAKSSELQAVFDSIGDGVAIYDSTGHVQHRNHICPRLFPRETIVGHVMPASVSSGSPAFSIQRALWNWLWPGKPPRSLLPSPRTSPSPAISMLLQRPSRIPAARHGRSYSSGT